MLLSTPLVLIIACIISVAGTVFTSEASAKTRSLKLYYLHTGERAEITYKRNGKYVKSGLRKINRFLRDWRRNEPTKMDPRLLDLVWEVYRESGSRKHIHVISGYRSPKTNTMLRKRGRGVASKSQHTYGKALDFYLPDVKLSKLRRIGLIKQAGGVGYYPKSGSPFVHLDTGRVRHWPRMSRSQLARVFPNGKTLHVPSDGKPLKGFNIAKARYEKRKRSQGKILITDQKELPKTPKPKKPGFFQRLVSGDEKDDNDSVKTPAPKPVKTTVEKPIERKENEAPELPEDELVVASLPDIVPVPRVAPRVGTEPIIAVEKPVEVVEPQFEVAQVDEPVIPVRAATPVPVFTPVPATSPEPAPGTIIESRTAELVPEPRPSPTFDQEQSNILALADPSQEPTKLRNAVNASSVPIQQQAVAARNGDGEPKALASLSTVEIQDIRERLRNTYGGTRTPRLGIAVPKPAGRLGNQGGKQVEVASFNRFAPIKQNVGLDAIRQERIEFSRDQNSPPTEHSLEAQLASLTQATPSIAGDGHIGVPIQKPVEKVPTEQQLVKDSLDKQAVVASLDPNESRISSSSEISTQNVEVGNDSLLAELRRLVKERKQARTEKKPVEPELVKTGVPALPSENPARLALATIVEPDETQQDPAYVVSLLPVEPDLDVNNSLISPAVNPVKVQQESKEEMQVASLSPIEPGVASSNKIALPTSNPERFSKRIEILNKLAEQAEEERLASRIDRDSALSVGSIPLIPTPTPRPGLYGDTVALASLRDDLVLEFEEDEAEDHVAIMPRINRTLGKFSMTDFNDNGIGKFALANDRSIRDISHIKPPAYGRNAILELPSSVLRSGFSSNQGSLPTNRFTKQPVLRTAFAKFDK